MKFKILIATIFAAILPALGRASDNINNQTDNMIISITIDGKTLTANLIDNSSTKALVEKLKQSNVTYIANDYGGFEKVGALGFTLPRNDQYVTTSPGDIILYQGSNLCLYYARNSWDFTLTGRINYENETELRNFLKAGEGEIEVTLSLQSAGINAVEADASSGADTEYYNLARVKVDANANGVVIAKRGNKSKKIIR